MAFFQFRKGRDEQSAAPAPAQTVAQMRRRAMHRLIGAALLVLAGVVGFPLVFDSQPRPIPVDLPIIIPDKNKLAPLSVTPAAVKPAASMAVAAAPAVMPPAPLPVAAAVVTTPPTPAAPVPALKAPATPAPVPAAPVADAPPPAKVNDANKAQALLEGKEPAAKPLAADGRFVVQVGAFSDADKVREVRQKVEASGLKTYTQVVETKDGSRTRVRVGPFADKAEATRVADKIKKLDLPAAILAL